MLTAEDLRAIAERHAKTEAAPWPIDAIEGAEAHADRAALLDLVRAMGESRLVLDAIQCGVCEACGRIIESHSKHPPEGHSAACVVPVLEAAAQGAK